MIPITTLWTTVLLTALSQTTHALTLLHTSRDAVSANIPSTGIDINELAQDPDRLHEAFTSHITTTTTTTSSTRAVSRARLSKRDYADTANELTDDGTACRATTMIYARGTFQDGNIGADGDVGPLTMNQLAELIGADQLAVQGVDYSASVFGFLGGGDEDGSQKMADLVAQANTQCPDTKIVMSGYSQGAQLVHNAAALLEESNTAALDQVAAVLLFGDPNNGDAVGNIPESKVRTFCNDGDNICDGGILVLPAHLNYQENAEAAAEWVASQV